NRYMTWQELRDARMEGVHIGSHTLTHPKLHALGDGQLAQEVSQSKFMIEDNLGAPVQSFSYPYAFPEQDTRFVERVRKSLQRYGYGNGVSTVIGTATERHDRFFLPRLPANSYDDLRLFKAKLEGAYDWLHTPQRLYKLLASHG